MTRRCSLACAFLAGLVAAAGCERPAPRAAAREAAPSQNSGATRTRGGRGAALVVLVVFDQLPSWALEKYGAALHPEGFLRAGARRGVWIERVSFPYAGTYTAPGHAAIVTGKSPSASGVAANERWDRGRGKVISAVDDGRHEVFGHPGAFASPTVLRADTVGDLLRRTTGGRARVVSLSVKDRSAVLMGGRGPDIAIWYDHALPGFTTSRYYADSEPAWLADWRRQHPVDRLLAPWTPSLPPALLEQLTGPDRSPGEADWFQLGTVFPHDPRASSKPYVALRALPALTDDLLALADAAVAAYQLGADDVPDLLAISIATTDYAGHFFGPESWEYLDALARVDRAVGAWLDRLAERAPIAVVSSADHGVAPLPERSAAAGAHGGRIDPIALEADLESALAAQLGTGEWIDTYEPPFIYLSASAEANPAIRSRTLAAATAHLARRTDIAWAGPVDSPALHRPESGSPISEELRRAIALSIPPAPDGDLFVVPAPFHAVIEDDPRDRGTGHGTPWPHDREVPALFYGPGIAPGQRHPGPLPQARVAATLAALLRLPWPDAALPGAP
jgi:Type I phosphodiesterase / nucleotide pyrophosphatase